MSKGWKIFFSILYYLFAFSIGLFLILVYPPAKMDELEFKYLNTYIENKEFEKAVDLLSYVYNKKDIRNEKITNESGIVIFEGLSLLEKTLEDNKKTAVMNEAYICIVYDLDKMQFYSNENKSVLKINGESVEILSHDVDGDGTIDSVPSLINSNYICFSVDKQLFNKLNTIELINKDGNSYFKLENLNYTFESEFFTVAKDFIIKYNDAYSDNAFSKEEDALLLAEYNKIHESNNDYQMINHYKTTEMVYDDATKESIWFIILYFIWVFILGDCLVGKRYIFKFIKFLFNKIKEKIKSPKKDEVSLGNNYFSMVTFEAIICEEFDKDIVVSYESEIDKQYNFKLIINKTTDYVLKQRIHSGKYKLLKIECPGYEVTELPEELEVKGYTMLIKFNIQNKK